MTKPGLLPEGFHDRLPPEADAVAAVEAQLLEVARRYGYERVDPPLAEFADELAARVKSGGLGRAVRFVDPVSQATIAFRPDLTAQVARIAATRMGHHPRPVRLSYAGSVLALRAGQLAPARERRQVGAELFGQDTVAAAGEIVGVAVEALNAAGVADISVDFTLPDLLDTLSSGPLPLERDVLDVLRDRLDAKDAAAVAAIAPAYLPLVEAIGPFARAMARLRSFDTTGVLTSRLDGLQAIADATDKAVTLTLDPTERHGFEFQRWLGFSIFAGESKRELGRGGTYLVNHPDGREEPATGFSLYLDAFPPVPPPERRRLFLPFGTPPAEARRLRAEGWVAVAALDEHDSPEAQLATHVWVAGGVQAL